MIVERVTLVLEHLNVFFDPAIERHPDRPGLRKHLRILYGRFVVDVIVIDEREALDRRRTIELALTKARAELAE